MARSNRKTTRRCSSFEYKKYFDNQEYKEDLLWRMTNVYSVIADHIDDSTTIPIPGIVKTYSTSDGKQTQSDKFIPQGICRAGRFWLVTAYDAEKKCNSVVYAVDPDQKELVSTIAVPNKYHAGGIAFDGENIWLTGNTSGSYKGEPFLQYVKFDDFMKMTETPLYTMSEEEISKPVYIKNTPSFLEYDDGIIWVGTYIGRFNTNESYLYGYKVVRDDDQTGLNTDYVKKITGFDSSAQGADIDGDYLYVSSSFQGSTVGVKTSFVTKYNIKPIKGRRKNLSVTDREVSRIEVPKMNEEILIEDGKVHIVFESASDTWRGAVIMTDRILALEQSLWD